MLRGQLGRGRSSAELGLLHVSTGHADEVMVVPRMATDIRAWLAPGERPQRPRLAKELDRPVRRGKAETRLEPLGSLVKLQGGEAAGKRRDCVEDSPSLRSCPYAVGERESRFLRHGL